MSSSVKREISNSTLIILPAWSKEIFRTPYTSWTQSSADISRSPGSTRYRKATSIRVTSNLFESWTGIPDTIKTAHFCFKRNGDSFCFPFRQPLESRSRPAILKILVNYGRYPRPVTAPLGADRHQALMRLISCRLSIPIERDGNDRPAKDRSVFLVCNRR